MKSTITIDVQMDEQRVPESIYWNATESTIQNEQKAKAFMLSIWDGADKAALRIDLWTKDMMVDEMADFYFQTMMTMADTYARATQYQDQADELKNFAKEFYQKFQAKQQESNKAL
ncbi:MAG: gliding motility protein GldC [Chitinophagaceae bacterium]|nr:MAG: gliding motility protein GldC [Chitinophagaceae bacterium]